MGYPSVSTFIKNDAVHRRELASAINLAVQGSINCTGNVTLNTSATTTKLVDQRISIQSYIDISPTTANAATAKKNGIWFSNQTTGSVIINHASAAAVDQTFKVIIIG